jgi:hypothetical protein
VEEEGERRGEGEKVNWSEQESRLNRFVAPVSRRLDFTSLFFGKSAFLAASVKREREGEEVRCSRVSSFLVVC